MSATSAIALELLEIWDRLSSRHVSLGAGCACGVGGVTLQLQDFEQDIVDFLAGQAERAKRREVSEFLQAHAKNPATGQWDVAALLEALAKAEDAEAAPFLLEKLGKTLRSFAKLHG